MKTWITLIGIVMLLASIHGAMAAECTDATCWGTYGRDNYKSNYQPYGNTGTGSFTQYSVSTGDGYATLVYDLDEDGVNEIIIQTGASLKIYDLTLTQIDSITSNGRGNIDIFDDGCSNGKPAVVIVSNTIPGLRTYCMNATSRTLYKDYEKILAGNNTPDLYTGIKCRDGTGSDKYCSFISTGGVIIQQFDPSSGWGTTNYYPDGNITAYLGAYGSAVNILIPPVGDLDGDSIDNDFAYWCCELSGSCPGDWNTRAGFAVYEIGTGALSSCDGTNVNVHQRCFVLDRGMIITDDDLIGITGGGFGTSGCGGGQTQKLDYNNNVINSRAGNSPKFIGNNRDNGKIIISDGDDVAGMTSGLTDFFSISTDPSFNSIQQSLIANLVADKNNKNITWTSWQGQKGPYGNVDWTSGSSCTGTTITLVLDINKDGVNDHLASCSGRTDLSLQGGTTNQKPTVKSLTIDPTNRLVNVTGNGSDTRLQLIGYGQDAEDDMITVGVDCYYDFDDSRESTYTLDTTPHFTAAANGTPYLCPATGTGAHQFKFYVGDPIHRTLTDLNSENGFWIAQDHTTPYFVHAQVYSTATNQPISGIRVTMTDFNIGDTEIAYLTTDGLGRALFTVAPGDDYNVTARQTTTPIIYITESVQCDSTSSAAVFCTIFMDESETINVTMQIKIRSKSDLSNIEGANVTITGLGIIESQLTDSTGIATFDNIESGIYEAVASATGYYGFTQWVNSELNYIFDLQPIIHGFTNMEIEILNIDNLLPVDQAIVEVYDPISGYDNTLLTDADGEALFIDVPSDSSVIVGAIKDGYEQNEVIEFTGGQNETTHHVMFLTPTGTLDPDSTTTIGNVTIQSFCGGLWVYEAREIQCTTDADCFTGMCTATGHCTAFDYNTCDEQDRPRNRRCIMSNTFTCGMENTTGWMLTNFLWMIVILIVVVGLALLMTSFRRR